MYSGFIPGSRASLAFDLMMVAMLAVIPLLSISVWFAHFGKNYRRHFQIQSSISIALLIVIVMFEIDIRLYGWKPQAKSSPYYDRYLFQFLGLHLFFSISTTFLWMITFIQAYRKMSDSKTLPANYAPRHRLLGRLAALDMLLTTITGYTFYYLAFMA